MAQGSEGLPYAAQRAVYASRRLEPADKLVWGALHGLDSASRKKGQRGAYIGASSLADRLGMTQHQIEHIRRKLVRLGLLATDGGRGQRGARYWPLLPEGVTALLPASKRDDWTRTIQASRDALDATLSMTANGADGRAIAAPDAGGSMAQMAAPLPTPQQFRLPRLDDASRRTGMAQIAETLGASMARIAPTNGADATSHYKDLEVGEKVGERMESVSAPTSLQSVSEDQCISTLPQGGAMKPVAYATKKDGAKAPSREAALQRIEDYEQRLVTCDDPMERRLLEGSLSRARIDLAAAERVA